MKYENKESYILTGCKEILQKKLDSIETKTDNGIEIELGEMKELVLEMKVYNALVKANTNYSVAKSKSVIDALANLAYKVKNCEDTNLMYDALRIDFATVNCYLSLMRNLTDNDKSDLASSIYRCADAFEYYLSDVYDSELKSRIRSFVHTMYEFRTEVLLKVHANKSEIAFSSDIYEEMDMQAVAVDLPK